jgi:hypothetical protein
MQAYKIKTVTKTTLNLAIGDEILYGNIVDGYESFKVWMVNRSENNSRMAYVYSQSSDGKIFNACYGVNTRFNIIDREHN